MSIPIIQVSGTVISYLKSASFRKADIEVFKIIRTFNISEEDSPDFYQ